LNEDTTAALLQLRDQLEERDPLDNLRSRYPELRISQGRHAIVAVIGRGSSKKFITGRTASYVERRIDSLIRNTDNGRIDPT
jgi:hypothetical protein